MNETAISLLIGALALVGTLINAAAGLRQRRNLPKVEEAQAEKERAAAEKLRQEIKDSLWKRIQTELDRLVAERDKALERVASLQTRIEKLEEENAKLHMEIALLKDSNTTEG